MPRCPGGSFDERPELEKCDLRIDLAEVGDLYQS
jgi:hypothetical protein